MQHTGHRAAHIGAIEAGWLGRRLATPGFPARDRSMSSLWAEGDRHVPFETYHENGQLRLRGTYNMGEACGTWIEGDGTRIFPPPYEPCPPGLEDGN